jgi:hypothetical protein
MDTSTLIDAVMREWDYSSSSSDNTAVRVKILDKAQEVSDEAWLYFDASDFMEASTTLTLAQGTNSIAGPSNFYKCGDRGAVVLRVSADDRRSLTYLPPGELLIEQEASGSATGTPEAYSIWAMDGTTDLIPEFHFDCLADVAYTISVHYTKTSPVLVDTTGVNSQLHIWPVMYHSLLYKGTLARAARVLGDTVRQQQFEGEFQRALALAKSTRVHGQESDERTGRGGYSAWRMH